MLYKIVVQSYSIVLFLWNLPIPVGVFVYCYGRIFHTIRRQSKITGTGRSQGGTTASTSRDQVLGQHQQASGAKLSRTEMNVLQTMIAVIVVFLLCWTVTATANILQLLGVSIYRKHIIAPRISCSVVSRASSCYELWSVTISTVCDKALKVTRRSAP